LERTAKMTNAIAAHPRETDSRHHAMACLLAAGGPAMAPRWRNGGHEWLCASDRGLACPVLGVFQTVETPLPQASISLAFRGGTGPMVARFLCGRRGHVREVQCGSPGASQPRRRVNGTRVLTFFLQPRGTLMVISWCRQAGGLDSAWPTGGRFERRRCGLGRSGGFLTLLTSHDPSGDDAVGLTWPIICRGNPSADDVARTPHHLRRRGHRSARGAADGWHRGGRQRCKLDGRRLDSIGRGARCARTNGADGAMAGAPSRCGPRRERSFSATK
jgi:hypothetical protein